MKLYLIVLLLHSIAFASSQGTCYVCKGPDNGSTCGNSPTECCTTILGCLQQLSNSTNLHIHILNGTYSGNGFCGIELGTHPLSDSNHEAFALNITGDASETVIDCQQMNRSITFNGTYISQLNLSGIAFQNGLVSQEGGCLSFYKMNTAVSGCSFKSCVGSNGGAIYSEDSRINLQGNITFQNNVAGNSGGAIYLQGGKLESSGDINAMFGGNRAGTGSGGSIYCYNSSISMMSSGSITFNLNLAQVKGGAIYSFESPIDISPYTIFSNNRAFGGGALGVQLNIPDAFVQIRGVFFNNYADSGGAIYYDGTSLLDLHDAIGHGNSVNRYGGFAYLLNFQYFALNEAFNNSAGMRGGGLFLGHTTASPLSAIGGLFWENKGESDKIDNIDCWTPDEVSICDTCAITSCRECGTLCSLDGPQSTCFNTPSSCDHGVCYKTGTTTYQCNCEAGWTGTLCDSSVNVPPTHKDLAWYWDVIIILVVVAVVVGIFIVIIKKIKFRQNRGEYELIE